MNRLSYAVANSARHAMMGRGIVLLWVAGFASVACAGSLQRRLNPQAAPDFTLQSVAFGVVFPVFAYAAAERSFARQQLSAALEPWSRHGAHRHTLVLLYALVSACILAATGVALAVIALASTYRKIDGLFLRDLGTSAWIGALAGAVYAAFYVLASSFGQRGVGRKWALLGDLVLGGQIGILAVPWPRGHVRSLLGGTPVFELSQTTSLEVLIGMAILYVLLVLARVSP